LSPPPPPLQLLLLLLRPIPVTLPGWLGDNIGAGVER
jgi:hypothetical protein